ncbi:hypothetical protein REPUB_Repub11eG0031900 [Reevesia pubescens]
MKVKPKETEEWNDVSKTTKRLSQKFDRLHDEELERKVAVEALIAKIFATISAIKAGYAQLQYAQSPYDAEGIQAADQLIVSDLKKLSELKQCFLKKQYDPSPEHAMLLADIQEQKTMKPKSTFAKFCRTKYLQVVHPKMESSFFGNLSIRDMVSSYQFPDATFFIFFAEVAKRVWLLHCLAFAFEPEASIFQISRGCRFSEVYMESVAEEAFLSSDITPESEPRVAFTVVPGFRIGKTVIQCQIREMALPGYCICCGDLKHGYLGNLSPCFCVAFNDKERLIDRQYSFGCHALYFQKVVSILS